TQNAVGRLCANANPVLGALGVQNNALLVVLGEQRIEGADLLDEAAVARRTGVSNDDLVERALLGATTGQADLEGHSFFLGSVDLIERGYFFLPKPGRPGKRGPPRPGKAGPPEDLRSALTSLGNALGAGRSAEGRPLSCSGLIPA